MTVFVYIYRYIYMRLYMYVCIYFQMYIYIHIYPDLPNFTLKRLEVTDYPELIPIVCFLVYSKSTYTCIYIYIYAYVHMYLYIYICTCIHVHIYSYIHIHIYIHIYANMHVCVCIYTNIRINIYKYKNKYTYIHTYIYKHMYIYIYTYMHIYRRWYLDQYRAIIRISCLVFRSHQIDRKRTRKGADIKSECFWTGTRLSWWLMHTHGLGTSCTRTDSHRSTQHTQTNSDTCSTHAHAHACTQTQAGDSKFVPCAGAGCWMQFGEGKRTFVCLAICLHDNMSAWQHVCMSLCVRAFVSIRVSPARFNTVHAR